MRVLIADDDPALRELCTLILKQAGHEVSAVQNGVEALAYLGENSVDLVLLDVVMPALDGISTLKLLREREALSELPIVLVSGRVNVEERLHGLHAGATDYITKPFEVNELVELIERLNVMPFEEQEHHREEVIATTSSSSTSHLSSHETHKTEDYFGVDVLRRSKQQEHFARLAEQTMAGRLPMAEMINQLLQIIISTPDVDRAGAFRIEDSHVMALAVSGRGVILHRHERFEIKRTDLLREVLNSSVHVAIDGEENGLESIVVNLGMDGSTATEIILPAGPCHLLIVQSENEVEFSPQEFSLMRACASLMAATVERERETQRVQDLLASLPDSTFVNSLAHELRTPLAAIIGFATLLKREATSPAADRVLGSARRMQQMIEDLLELDRISRGVAQTSPQSTDLEIEARHVIKTLNLQDHELVLDVEDAARVARVDPAHFDRIVEVLLSNIDRHTSPGTPAQMHIEKTPSGILISVEDQGPGIPDEQKEAIFSPFHERDLSGSAFPTGLSLSLVAEFAKMEGGKVWVEDNAGGGSVFCVLLGTPDAAMSRTSAESAG